MSLQLEEPISPELVLVAPELRTLALAALWDAPALPEAPERTSPGTLVSLLLYAAWQSLFGALLGLAAFASFGALVLAISFLAR